MIIDRTGTLANVKRHDYLPFGEELYAAQGLRSTTLGYTGDNVRQKFTSYERDTETDLDYAEARYYGSKYGRFTSVDPLTASAITGNPQTFNRYTYALNSPQTHTDPTGMLPIDQAPGGWGPGGDEGEGGGGAFSGGNYSRYLYDVIVEATIGDPIVEPPQNSPTATIMPGATPEQEARIQAGFEAAENLIRTVRTCSAFFGGAQKALSALDYDTAYKVDSGIDPTGSGHPQAASVIGSTYVLLNPKGGVFAAKEASFDVAAPGSKLSQSSKITLGGKEAAAFVFLHETAHKMRPNRFGNTDKDFGKGDKYLLGDIRIIGKSGKPVSPMSRPLLDSRLPLPWQECRSIVWRKDESNINTNIVGPVLRRSNSLFGDWGSSACIFKSY